MFTKTRDVARNQPDLVALNDSIFKKMPQLLGPLHSCPGYNKDVNTVTKYVSNVHHCLRWILCPTNTELPSWLRYKKKWGTL